MDELLANTLNTYYKILSNVGYMSYSKVFKIMIIQYIQELFNSVYKNYITDEDVRLMNNVLYQIIGSTCEISFPSNCGCGKIITPDEPVVTPTITNFKMIPSQTSYEGTQTISFTGFSYTITNKEQLVDNSMNLLLDDKIIKSNIDFSKDLVSLSPNISQSFTEGKSYAFKISATGKDGNTYYSNTFVIVINKKDTPPTVEEQWMYTGNTAAKPTETEILAGDKYDYNKVKEFVTPKYTLRTIWVCLPTNVTLVSMENTNFSDFLININTGRNILKSESVTINSKAYTLYYLTTIPSKSPYRTIVK